MSQLNPSNVASRTEESAPNYDSHYYDVRYHPSAEAIAAEALQLEPHPQLSTITNPDLARSRLSPPPHFSTIPNSAYPMLAITQSENQPLPSPSFTNTSRPTTAISHVSRNSATPVPPDPSPPFLTLDKDLIFPPPPSHALYSLKYAISAAGTSNILRKSIPATHRADGSQRSGIDDKDLYSISRNTLLGTFTIEGQRRSTVSGRLVLRRDMNLLGRMSWQCRVEKTNQILLKSKGNEWLDAQGQVLGREEGGVVMRRKERKAKKKANSKRGEGVDVPWEPPVLELVGAALDVSTDGGKIRDLLVACWVGKCWFTEVQTNEKFSLPPAMRTKNKYSRSMGGVIVGSE